MKRNVELYTDTFNSRIRDEYYFIEGDLYSRKRKMPFRSLHHSGYYYVTVTGNKKIGAHRIIWFLHKGEWPAGDIDHINGDTKDNRIENLRECTRAQNSMNSKITEGCSSKYKGVSQKGKKWQVGIRIDNKLIYLGQYKNEAFAAKVYDCAARMLFGEFARTNFDA